MWSRSGQVARFNAARDVVSDCKDNGYPEGGQNRSSRECCAGRHIAWLGEALGRQEDQALDLNPAVFSLVPAGNFVA